MLNPMLKNKPVDTEINAENISKDSGGVLLRSVLNELTNASAGVQRKLNSGLNQETFKRHNAFKESIDCAIVVLERTWSRLQR
ncbi:hypothetical protein BTA51_14025 [Hahella sp. CCB-MM4]|uniref:hypothetical protein n=1 Tax=Hahella sp. (strain CCB-MM4) TaxID=1926491 RepID=UPI000B9B27C7|nr:hypothetical protein [Hahella sp. CCB-MM4]OZG72643.1 hypothetical protein BTA51_14025 [Hahella sp. CCB-MM4]